MGKDYYNILGVNKNADEKEIKKSYRKLSKQYHPDLNPNNKQAEEKFKDIAEAYSVLSDSEKRSNYDRFGTADGRGNPFSNGGFDMNDIFNSFFGDEGNPFGGGRRRRVVRGTDIRVNLKITLEDIFNGVHKKIKYKRNDSCTSCDSTGGKSSECQTCRGTGQVTRISNTPFGRIQNTAMCSTCGGEGKIIIDPCKKCSGNGVNLIEETVEFDLPKGIMEGENLVLKTKGNSIKGGLNGDLIINIIEVPHEKFKRKNQDIYQRIKLKYKDLVLGSPHELETLDGKIRINVKAGTEIGHILRVPKKGLTRDNYTGDMMVEVWLDIPKDIDDENKKIIESLNI